MRDDYSRAAESLRLLGRAVRDCDSKHRDRLSAYIIKLARLVQDNPLLRAAVVELEREERADEDVFAARVSQLSACTLAAFKQLLCAKDPLGEPAMRIFRNHRPANVRVSAPTSFSEVEQAIKNGQNVEFLPADIVTLNSNFSTKLRDALKGLEDDDQEVTDVLDACDACDALGASASGLLEVESLMKRASIGRLAARLRAYATRWDERLGSAHSSAKLLSDGIELDIPFFVELVAAQVEEGVIRIYALHRLRLLFEQFEYDVLRARLMAAEIAKEPREKLLQDAMDRFLFQDGYFPVTHSSASRGSLDTLLLENADNAGVPPILIELKQVTSFAEPSEASRAAVVAAIASARGEVERYRGHVATRPQWSRTMPVIVVVHTCNEDLSDLEGDDVVLIDLSPVTPSKKRRRRVES
jgi:hypothetical protein